MPARKRVTIVETAHHFLYLPVHYALHEHCFGCVPDRYELGLWPAPRKTDRQAYELLKSGRGEGHDYIGFAVADPAELLHDKDSNLSPPVVLAGLITNSSFWAVDRRSHAVRFISDLAAFDSIIAFSEGTTSNGIAERIYRDAKKTSSIIPVQPGAELTVLTASGKGTLALTPDLLALDKLLADHSDVYHVDLALGKTPEYNNVLVTALLSRTDVVTEHPELVRGLVKAIQRATLLVRLADPEIVKYAMDEYGESEARIRGALRRAGDAQVFPGTIEVSQSHWENAGRAAADAGRRTYDANEHDRVCAVYLGAVTPYQGIIQQAIREDILPRLKTEFRGEVKTRHLSKRFIEGGVSGLALGALLGAALAALLQLPLLAVGVAALAALIWISLRLPMNRWVRAFQITWLVAGGGMLLWWALTKPSSSTLATPVWGWVGAELAILLTAAGISKRQL